MSSKLKRTPSNSSLASLSSRGSQKILVPEARAADFLDENEIYDRGTFAFAPLDVKRFKKLNQNVQPHSAVPEPVRNKRFNRHMDVLPHPATRVQLPQIGDDLSTTYINANYIHGPDGNPRSYICAMGPLSASLKNWWRMIWQEKVTCIIMATELVEKGTKKCERYWAPKPGQKVKVADMFVRTLAVSQGNGYVRTLLEIEHTDGSKRKLMHFWYNTWPDHGVPRTPDGKPDATNLLYMIRDSKRSESELNEGGPVLTHCSAGVGRSGTLIAIDYACQLLEANGKADLCSIIEEIRQDRVALVQHPQQYELAHAGVVLYAQFVQANMSLDKKAQNAGFSYNPQALKEKIKSATHTSLLVSADTPYGEPVTKAVPSDSPSANPVSAGNIQQADSPYGTHVPLANKTEQSEYGTMVAPVNVGQPAASADVYGTPVSVAPQPTVLPDYAVMQSNVPQAKEISTYSTADDPPPVPQSIVYGDDNDEPVVVKAAQVSASVNSGGAFLEDFNKKARAVERQEDTFGFGSGNTVDHEARKAREARQNSLRSDIFSLKQRLDEKRRKLQQLENAETALLVQTLEQRVQTKKDEIAQAEKRLEKLARKKKEAENAAFSAVAEERKRILSKAVCVFNTKSHTARHAQYLKLSMAPVASHGRPGKSIAGRVVSTDGIAKREASAQEQDDVTLLSIIATVSYTR